MFNRPGEVKAVLQTVSSLNLAWTHKNLCGGTSDFAWEHQICMEAQLIED